MKKSLGLGMATYHRILNNIDFTASLLSNPVSENLKYLDTSPIYAQGRAESWIGKNPEFGSKFRVIRKVGLDYTFITKLGFRIPHGKSIYGRIFPTKIKKISGRKVAASYARSRKRLKTIEPYGILVHSYDGSEVSIEQLYQLRRLKKMNSRVRIGVSMDQVLPTIPSEIDILEINADFSSLELLQDFRGILIINQVFQRHLSETQLNKFTHLDIEEIVLLLGSTRVERIQTFVAEWQTKFIQKSAN